ncbi:MAG: kelch repeat-containing protein [Candidatus Bathyarchaeia archaeon]|jgi:energy-converting hydrogenase Eha subunit A
MKRYQATIIVLLVLFLVLPTTVWATQEDTWTTKEPMPRASYGVKAAVVNEKIYVMNSDFNYEYDLESWSTKTSMLTPRNRFALTSYQNKIYCIGGITESESLGTNEVYDPASDSWETKTAMPTPRHGLDANVVNGKIYMISGFIPHHLHPYNPTTFEFTDINDVYDIATDTWETKTPIPNPAGDYASAVVNNKIYIISENCTQIYNPETDTWSYGTQPLRRVDIAGGVATTGSMAPERIYVIGGRKRTLEVPYTQIYNPINNTWSLGTPIPTPRYGFAIAAVNDQIYTIGGVTGAFVALEPKNNNEQYTPIGYGTVPPQNQQPTSETGNTEPFPLLEITLVATVCVILVAAVIIKKKKHQHPKF